MINRVGTSQRLRLSPSGDSLLWHKSRRSSFQGTCVEVAALPMQVFVRDSKDPEGPVLSFDQTSWAAFVAAVKSGEIEVEYRFVAFLDDLGAIIIIAFFYTSSISLAALAIAGLFLLALVLLNVLGVHRPVSPDGIRPGA